MREVIQMENKCYNIGRSCYFQSTHTHIHVHTYIHASLSITIEPIHKLINIVIRQITYFMGFVKKIENK